MAQQSLDFGTSAPNDGEFAPTAFQKIEDNFDELYSAAGAGLLNSVSVAGRAPAALIPGDSSSSAKAANTAAINAAAAYALANGVKEIVISPGTFWCDQEIEIGVGGADQKSLHLKGSGGGAVENQNTVLRFSGVTTVAVNTGNGQHMQVSDLAIVGDTSPTSRAALTGVGLGLNHNSHQNPLSNVRVVGFHTGVKTGYDGDVLCDSLSLGTCSISDCYIGLHISQTQNYINDLDGCVISGCTIGVKSDVAKAVNVKGGNISTSDGKKAAFTIGSVSILTNVTDNNGQLPGASYVNAQFTAVVSSPDQPLADGAYDAFVINTTAFGPIPFIMTNYNSGTATIALRIQAGWLVGTYGDAVDFEAASGLGALFESQLQAATTLYACETIIPFQGFCFNVDGTHIENPDTLTTFFDFTSSFGGDTVSRFNRINFNYDLDHVDAHGGTAAQEAVFLCQQVHPFIRLLHSASARIELSNIGTAHTVNRVIIDTRNDADHRLLIGTNVDLRPNIRVAFGMGFTNETGRWWSSGRGFGEWDATPFAPDSPGTLGANWQYKFDRHSASPFRGYFPAPWSTPMIPAPHLEDIRSGPGTLGTYTPLCGGIVYRLEYGIDNGELPPAVPGASPVMVLSKHSCFSYGQNLTVDWDYVGGTKVVRLSDADRMFQGLKVLLNNGGGAVGYIVTGVYPSLGYITVAGTFGNNLSGTVGTDYNGATVEQEAYDIVDLVSTP